MLNTGPGWKPRDITVARTTVEKIQSAVDALNAVEGVDVALLTIDTVRVHVLPVPPPLDLQLVLQHFVI